MLRGFAAAGAAAGARGALPEHATARSDDGRRRSSDERDVRHPTAAAGRAQPRRPLHHAGATAVRRTIFHRVIRYGSSRRRSAVEGSAKAAHGTGGPGVPRAELSSEKHTAGTVTAVLAPNKPDSAGAQFFASPISLRRWLTRARPPSTGRGRAAFRRRRDADGHPKIYRSKTPRLATRRQCASSTIRRSFRELPRRARDIEGPDRARAPAGKAPETVRSFC